MMEQFFCDIMNYMCQYMSGGNADIQEYASEKPYYIIWKQGNELILDGVSEVSLRIALEYEKNLLIKNKDLTKEELLEIIMMEHIIYSIHSGKLYQIGEIMQTFAPEDITIKYVKVMEALYHTDEEMKGKESCNLTSM